jgi:hypothetical protein
VVANRGSGVQHASVSAQVQINKLKVVEHCSGSETTIVLMWCVPEVCAASLFLAGLKLLLVLDPKHQRSVTGHSLPSETHLLLPIRIR